MILLTAFIDLSLGFDPKGPPKAKLFVVNRIQEENDVYKDPETP
jgi:hypothetical protein